MDRKIEITQTVVGNHVVRVVTVNGEEVYQDKVWMEWWLDPDRPFSSVDNAIQLFAPIKRTSKKDLSACVSGKDLKITRERLSTENGVNSEAYNSGHQ